jgi:hypothetical protein
MKGAISMGEEKVRTEEYKVSSDESVAKVKELIAEGNVRRVIIQTDEGKTLIKFPLTIGVAAAAGVLLLAPLLAAVGVLAAIVTDLTIVIERERNSRHQQRLSKEPWLPARAPHHPLRGVFKWRMT